MHIVLVSRELPPMRRCGGIGRYVDELAKKISERHDVTVISSLYAVPQPNNEYELIGIPFADFSDKGGGVINKLKMLINFLPYRICLLWALRKLHAKKPVDLVEVPEYGAEGIFLCGFTKRNSIRLHVRIHGPTLLDRETPRIRLYSFTSPLKSIIAYMEMLMVRRADVVSVPSQSFLLLARKFFTKGSELKYLPNFIDTKEWAAREKVIEYKNCIFFAGTLVKAKGILLLVDAHNQLMNDGVSLELVVAGRSGRTVVGLEGDKQSYVGILSKNELVTYYSSSEIVCIPSYYETFGLVLVEAMAAGALIIAADNDVFREMIIDGDNGFLFKSGSSSDLKSVISKVLALSELERNKVRENAVNASKQWDVNAFICSYERYLLDECRLD